MISKKNKTGCPSLDITCMQIHSFICFFYCAIGCVGANIIRPIFENFISKDYINSMAITQSHAFVDYAFARGHKISSIALTGLVSCTKTSFSQRH